MVGCEDGCGLGVMLPGEMLGRVCTEFGDG